MVDGVIEAILMLFFLKSLRNGEKRNESMTKSRILTFQTARSWRRRCELLLSDEEQHLAPYSAIATFYHLFISSFKDSSCRTNF